MRTYAFNLENMTKAAEELRPIISTDREFAAECSRSMSPQQVDGKLSGMIVYLDKDADSRLATVVAKYGARA